MHNLRIGGEIGLLKIQIGASAYSLSYPNDFMGFSANQSLLDLGQGISNLRGVNAPASAGKNRKNQQIADTPEAGRNFLSILIYINKKHHCFLTVLSSIIWR